MPSSLHESTSSHWWMPFALTVTMLLLFAGQALPVMSIEKLVFWESEYSILVGAINLMKDGYVFLSLVVILFSVIFPVIKVLMLFMVWFKDMTGEDRQKTLHWLGVLGKWSMLDVFIVAVLIVLASSKSLGDAHPKIGLYLFSAAIFLSMILTMMISRTAKAIDGNKGGDEG